MYITVRELAEDIGLDRSNTRKYVLNNGFSFTKIRDKDSRQLVNALSEEDAESIRMLRQGQGFDDFDAKQSVVSNGDGFFYIIQLVPDLDPLRVKLGFASCVKARLAAHRTSAPTAELVEAFPCKLIWERTAIDSITRIGCGAISKEVYSCDDLSALVGRATEFFALMP